MLALHLHPYCSAALFARALPQHFSCCTSYPSFSYASFSYSFFSFFSYSSFSYYLFSYSSFSYSSFSYSFFSYSSFSYASSSYSSSSYSSSSYSSVSHSYSPSSQAFISPRCSLPGVDWINYYRPVARIPTFFHSRIMRSNFAY